MRNRRLRWAERAVLALMIFIGKNLSTFYYPHLVHDAKGRPLSKPSPLAATHSDRLGARLKTLLTSDRQREHFMDTEREIIELKTAFYDQFTAARAD